ASRCVALPALPASAALPAKISPAPEEFTVAVVRSSGRGVFFATGRRCRHSRRHHGIPDQSSLLLVLLHRGGVTHLRLVRVAAELAAGAALAQQGPPLVPLPPPPPPLLPPRPAPPPPP